MKTIIFFLLIAAIPLRSLEQKIDSATLASLTPATRFEVLAHIASAKKATDAANGFLIFGAAIQVASVVAATQAEFSENQDAAILISFFFITGTSLVFTSLPFYHHARLERAKIRLLINNDQHANYTPAKAIPYSSSIALSMVICIGK